MNFGFSIDFFAVWPGGRRCANCRDAHFFERYCDESIFTWKTFKTTMEKTKKKFRPMGKVWGEAWQGTWVWTFFFVFFLFFHDFWQFGQNLKNTHKKKSDPWARSGLSTHKPKNQKNKKPRNQKNKKTKKQKTKKTKKQKTKKKNKKTRPNTLHLTPSPWGVQSWFFWFVCFFGFLVSWFLGFLVCVWIAQALPMGLNFLFFFVFFCSRGFGQTAKNHGKTKKPKNQETKKTKNQKKQKKPRLHTPRGGGQMQSVGSCLFVFFVFFGFLFFWFFVFLVFCFFWFFVFLFFWFLGFLFFGFLFFGFLVFLFFWFFGLDSHCRCAKQRLPGTVSGCTRSKVDTLQYSNVCYDIVHSANEQQRGMEFNFVRLRHMLLDLCTGNAAICALPQWPVL